MFTIREISELAVQIESNGEAVYREAARRTQDPKLRRLLEQIAEEEARHGRWFTQLQDDSLGDQRVDESDLEAMGRALLADMVGEQTFSLDVDRLSRAQTEAQVIAQAVELERDTIVFYEMLADFIQEASVAAYLQTIITEERSHIEKLGAYLEVSPVGEA